MKSYLKLVLLLLVSVALTGCAVRNGHTKKIDGYQTKLTSIAVVYREGQARDARMAQKLERYNFQLVRGYLAKVVPPAFSPYGIAASFTGAHPESSQPAATNQTLYISPATVSTTKHKDLPVSTGPSLAPVRVDFEVYLFDSLVKREAWSGTFSVVVGGLLYDSFTEEKTAELVQAVIKGMVEDGLLNSPH